MPDPNEVREEWRDWVARNIGGPEERISAATEAAVALALQERSVEEVVAAARHAAENWEQTPAEGSTQTQRRRRSGVPLGVFLVLCLVAAAIVFGIFHNRRVQRPQPPVAPQQVIIIGGPSFKGLRVDNCLHWTTACGQPAADYFCSHILHLKSAKSFQTEKIRPTWVLGDNTKCDADFCVGFRQIECNR